MLMAYINPTRLLKFSFSRLVLNGTYKGFHWRLIGHVHFHSGGGSFDYEIIQPNGRKSVYGYKMTDNPNHNANAEYCIRMVIETYELLGAKV